MLNAMYVLYFSVQPQHGAGSNQTGRVSFWYGPVRRIEPSCLDCVSEHLCVCPLCFFLCVCFEFFDLILSPPTPPPPPPPPQSRNKVRGESSCLSVLPCVWLSPDSSVYYLLNCSAFCNQTWYGGGSSWARVSCPPKKEGLLSSRSKSQWGLIQSVYGCFRYIFWTNGFWQPTLVWW